MLCLFRSDYTTNTAQGQGPAPPEGGERSRTILITINVPDDTVRILYTQRAFEGNYETDMQPVTTGMIVRVENNADVVASAAQLLAERG